MYLPTTHAALGVLGAVLARAGSEYVLDYKIVIWGMVFGVLPDLDYIYYLIRCGIRPVEYSHEHRQAVTHSFFPHLAVSTILFFVWGRPEALVYLFAVLSHLVLDSVHPPWGIRWLWPASGNFYSIGFRSGFTAIGKKELDRFVKTRADRGWVRRFVRLNNPYFIFEALIFLSFVSFLIYFCFYL